MSDFKVAAVSSASSGNSIKTADGCKILVVGVGGGGGNSVQYMLQQGIDNVEFVVVNTDSRALQASLVPNKLQIGINLTQGLGAGTNPNVGRKAAEESREAIKKLLQGADMVFIAAGMGGGTGTGAAPLIAEIARKECSALTVAVVTKPFTFEGRVHQVNAQAGITDLAKNVDALTIVDNNKLLKNLGANVSIINAFNAANNVLYQSVHSVTDIINKAGFINVDFNDIKMAMLNRGMAVIGTGFGKGPSFVEDAVQQAVHNPLIEQVDINSASGLLVHIRVNPNFSIAKIDEICQEIKSYADESADTKHGLTFDEAMAEDEIAVTIIISGISTNESGRTEKVLRPNRMYQPVSQTEGGFFTMSQQQTALQLQQTMPSQPQLQAQPSAQPQPLQSPARSFAQPQTQMQAAKPFLGAAPASPAPAPEHQVQNRHSAAEANAFFTSSSADSLGGPISFGGSIQQANPLSRDTSSEPAARAEQVVRTEPMPSTSPSDDELWNVPPILRNKAD